jgi:diaminopimelate epimerase
MHFYKLQGAGNDFVVIDCRDNQHSLNELIQLTPHVCNRRFGVGADGVMALFPPQQDSEAYTMIYRNADGSDAGMCGNGGRCIAKLAVHLGIDPKHAFRVHQSVYQAEVKSDSVLLNFPAEPTIIPVSDETYGTIYQIHTGTEHIVVYLKEDAFADADLLKRAGKTLRFDSRFGSKGTNVNFILSEIGRPMKIKTYERGVEDLTLACGTGTIAAAIVHHYVGNLQEEVCCVPVQNTGGQLIVHFEKSEARYTNLALEGPAEIVFKGVIRV